MVEIIDYTSDWADEWDRFSDTCSNSTFLSTRKFLSYHGQRFNDKSILLLVNDELVGVLPAAQACDDDKTVCSHPGVTFGGLIHGSKLVGDSFIKAFENVLAHYLLKGFEKFEYRPVPWIYHTQPSQDDLYALFRVGAHRSACGLSSTINLSQRRPPSNRRKRSFKKASKAVSFVLEDRLLPEVWRVIEGNLQRRHSAAPVHSLEEITTLHEMFPMNIRIAAGLLDGAVVAGVIVFISRNVWHAQYIASDEVGYETNALDVVFEGLILGAREYGAKYFDFGTSNEQRGLVLNSGLYGFKTEFGGGGVAYETYTIKC